MFTHGMTMDEIRTIEARAKAIIKEWNKAGGRRAGCNCYHPEDTGENAHAPDCAFEVAGSEQWEAACEQATDELEAQKGDA